MNRLKWTKKSGVYECLCLLILYMPFHYYICECLIKGTKIDNCLRDIIIITLLIVTLLIGKFKVGKHDIIVITNCLVVFLFAICSLIIHNYPGTINILRTYLIPQLIFVICSRLKINEKQYSYINKIIVVELALIAIYGVFQAFILGDKFLVKLGYPSDGYYLSSASYYISGFFGHQRSVGTFISPNICGVILAISICIYLYSNMLVIKRKKMILFFLIVGLIATFSRSAIVGLVLSIVIVNYLSGKKVHISKRIIIIGTCSVAAACLVIVYVDSHYLGGLFGNMILRSLTSALDKTDPSAAAHMENLIGPLSEIFNHPFGFGFGNNGPMALDYTSNAKVVESSFYLMIYDLGLFFGIIFFIPYFCVIIDTIRNRKYKNFLPAAIAIAVCFTYVLLPNVQTFEILFYSFMYMGFYYNPNIRKIYYKNKINNENAIEIEKKVVKESREML